MTGGSKIRPQTTLELNSINVDMVHTNLRGATKLRMQNPTLHPHQKEYVSERRPGPAACWPPPPPPPASAIPRACIRCASCGPMGHGTDGWGGHTSPPLIQTDRALEKAEWKAPGQLHDSHRNKPILGVISKPRGVRAPRPNRRTKNTGGKICPQPQGGSYKKKPLLKAVVSCGMRHTSSAVSRLGVSWCGDTGAAAAAASPSSKSAPTRAFLDNPGASAYDGRKDREPLPPRSHYKPTEVAGGTKAAE